MDDILPLNIIDMNSQTVSAGGSDSSSDEGIPVVKKTKSKTIRRGLSHNKIPIKTKTSPKPVKVYSTRVVKCLQDCKAGRIHFDIDQDDTEDCLQEESVATCNSNNNSTDDDHALLDDSDTNITNICKSNSPSPPPTPNIVTEKRRTRKMKNAIKKLDAVRSILRGSVDHDDDDDVVLLEDSPLQEKQNIVVLVRYKETVHRFQMKRFDPFCYTLTKLSEILNVSQNQLVLLLKDKTVSSSDTPASVNLHIADIIDCHIYTANPSEEESKETETSDPDAISLCVQCMSSRSKVTMNTNKYQPLRTLMVRFAAMKKIELSYLRFQFDGEDLLPSATPVSLDMEDGDCIDAIEL